MKKSLFRNLSLQSFLQLLNTIIPLITTPYVSRKIGSDGLGLFSYATSIVAYFTLIAMLGTLNYGVRSIAEVKDDIEARSRRFFEIYYLQVTTVFIASVGYLVCVSMLKADRAIMLLQFITLLGYLFDISWFFQGIEDFKITVSVSMIVRLLSLAAIFIFVHKPEDLYVYTIIMLGSAAAWQAGLWFFVGKRLVFVKIKYSDILKHIRPNLVLFIPLIAMTIFHYMDKTMLGSLSTYEQGGYYYNVDKLITIPLGIFTGIGTVMLPKMTSLFLAEREKALFVLRQSLEGVIALGVAIGFGIFAISEEFVPFFLGDEYMSCVLLTKVLAPILVVKGLSNAIRAHYLVPAGLDKIYICSVVVGVVVNVVCNYLLIPKYGALGAIIATILAELTVLFVELYATASELKLSDLAKKSVIYTLIGVIMVMSVRCIGSMVHSKIIGLVAEILTGGLVYCGITMVFWHFSRNMMYNEIVCRVKLFFAKREK